MDSGHFRLVEADRLKAMVDGIVADVVGVIDSGECAHILDCLLYAERQHEGRVAVLNAIVGGSEAIGNAPDEDDPASGVRVADVTTTR